jgi:hypothetical protein
MNMAAKAIHQQFNVGRRIAPWSINHYGSMLAAKAHPLACCAFLPGEAGTISTDLDVALAPVSGHMLTNAYVDLVQVFVPYQAIEKLELDTQEDAGVTEMARRRLEAGQGIGLEDAGDVSGHSNVHGKRVVDGPLRVSKTVRLAYIAAVNHLMKAAYHGALQYDKNSTAILPAILTANILERFNGVLDPERTIDGAINLTGELPVKGIGMVERGFGTTTETTVREAGEGTNQTIEGWEVGDTHGNNSIIVERTEIEGTSFNVPDVRVDLDGVTELTLRDMVRSQKLDGLVRKFARMIQADPINGEQKVARALYGLSVDYDHNCQVLYRKVHELSPMHQRPSDGASINDVSAHYYLRTRFATVVPRGELGGQVVTIAMVKPLEVTQAQPDPRQTRQWALTNKVHDELDLDEVLLTRAELETNVAAADKDQAAFWVGHNALLHDYATQGPNWSTTGALSVEMQSTAWTYNVPTSVTPENVAYPASITMYPFFNWNGRHAEYHIRQHAMISTPMAKGPTPVERIQLFADDPTLLDADG